MSPTAISVRGPHFGGDDQTDGPSARREDRVVPTLAQCLGPRRSGLLRAGRDAGQHCPSWKLLVKVTWLPVAPTFLVSVRASSRRSSTPQQKAHAKPEAKHLRACRQGENYRPWSHDPNGGASPWLKVNAIFDSSCTIRRWGNLRYTRITVARALGERLGVLLRRYRTHGDGGLRAHRTTASGTF